MFVCFSRYKQTFLVVNRYCGSFIRVPIQRQEPPGNQLTSVKLWGHSFSLPYITCNKKLDTYILSCLASCKPAPVDLLSADWEFQKYCDHDLTLVSFKKIRILIFDDNCENLNLLMIEILWIPIEKWRKLLIVKFNKRFTSNFQCQCNLTINQYIRKTTEKTTIHF